MTISVFFDWKYEHYIDPVSKELRTINVAHQKKNFEIRDEVKEFLEQHHDAIVMFDTSRKGVIWTREYL